jgi:protein SCO1/2
MIRKIATVCLFLCLLSVGRIGFADQENQQVNHDTEVLPSSSERYHRQDQNEVDIQNDSGEAVGVEEKLGTIIPLELTFQDEHNQPLILRDFINKPTLLLPVYFYCTQSCGILLANLAASLNEFNSSSREGYQVVALSFDEAETSEIALEAKVNYLKILQKDFPEEKWKFLTGDAANIQAMAAAIGFQYKKTGQHLFAHPNVLVAIASDGKIIRYLYGPNFLPFDIGMALAEAVKGEPGISIKKILTFCFNYDAKSKRYVFRTFRILGTVIVILLAAFFFFVLRKGNK